MCEEATQSNWSDQVEKSFEYARDSSRQVLTLASAILTLSVALIGQFLPKGQKLTGSDAWFLRAGWILLLASVLFGAMTLLQIAGEASPTTIGVRRPLWSEQKKTWKVKNTPLHERNLRSRPPMPKSGDFSRPSIYAGAIRAIAGLQMVCFFFGLVAFVIFGWRVLTSYKGGT